VELLSYTVNNLFIFNKPVGLNSHASSTNSSGLVEIATKYLSRKLYVIHRLDKDVSGVIVFTDSKAVSQKLITDFSERRIEKTYLGITDRPCSADEFTCDTPLQYQSGPSKEAFTYFEAIAKHGPYTKFRITPTTGRTHQIRKHAAALGIPLLGCSLYGGTSFPRLMLHAETIKLNDEFFTTPTPTIFNLMELIDEKLAVNIICSIEKYTNLFKVPINEICHFDDGVIKFGIKGVKQLYSKEEAPISKTSLSEIKRLLTVEEFAVLPMINRGGSKLVTPPLEWLWEAEEGLLKYSLAKGRGHSLGIFPDQRYNREYIRKVSEGKRVLNLFSYSGAFTLSALSGGAESVTNVDISGSAHKWCEENLALNLLPKDRIDFYLGDAIFFCQKKSTRKYEIVICDPPTFARLKGGKIFRLERDFDLLIKSILLALTDNGIFLFSCNYAAWSDFYLKERIKKLLPRNFKEVSLTEVLTNGSLASYTYLSESLPKILAKSVIFHGVKRD
jgi:23S rRNA (cytosine1962-C5)-methyltransferase